MKCPICGTYLPPSADRCPDCGYHCGSVRPQPAAYSGSTYEPPNKSKRPKCCCCAAFLIVPLLLALAAAILFGAQLLAGEDILEEFVSEYYENAPAPAPVPETIPADEAAEGCFSIRNGLLTFLPHKWEGGSVLRVPSAVDGQRVIAIAPGCFRDCPELTTIVLPNTVNAIGQEAFSGCTSLRGLLIPEGTTSVGADAFSGCVSLEALYVPASVTDFAPGALDDCASLLYIFYDGSFDRWNGLYSGFVNPFTTAICIDGAYYQGAAG